MINAADAIESLTRENEQYKEALTKISRGMVGMRVLSNSDIREIARTAIVSDRKVEGL
jgi:hypothetical protein